MKRLTWIALGALACTTSALADTQWSDVLDLQSVTIGSHRYDVQVRTFQTSSSKYIVLNASDLECRLLDIAGNELSHLEPGDAIDAASLGVSQLAILFVNDETPIWLDLNASRTATIRKHGATLGMEMQP